VLGRGGSAASPWSAKELSRITGQWPPRRSSAGDGAAAAACAAQVATHPLRLRSAYVAATGAEPAYTSSHSQFMDTCDYLFLADAPAPASGGWALRPRCVLMPPDARSVARRGLPAAGMPSDHVAIMAQLELYAVPPGGDGGLSGGGGGGRGGGGASPGG